MSCDGYGAVKEVPVDLAVGRGRRGGVRSSGHRPRVVLWVC